MRTPRPPESEEQRTEREADEARERVKRIANEDEAIDAAVKKSIKNHGA